MPLTNQENEKKFVLRNVFKDVMNMKIDEEISGPVEMHYDIPWKTRIVKNPLGEFIIYLDCPVFSESKDWSIDLTITKKLLGNFFPFTNSRQFLDQDKSSYQFSIVPGAYPRNIVKKFSNSVQFLYKTKSHSPFFIGPGAYPLCIVNGEVTVEFSCRIDKMTGSFKLKKKRETLMKFDESISEFSDVVLVVGNQKFFVIKKYLALHSTYFNSLFFGNFAESEKSEIELKDLDADEFQCFLELIYGEPSIDDETLKSILKLADFFDSKVVMRRCEEFSIYQSQKSYCEKFKIAVKYGLEKLQRHNLPELKTADEIRSIIPKDLHDFDVSLWHKLLLKSLELATK